MFDRTAYLIEPLTSEETAIAVPCPRPELREEDRT